MRQLSLMGKEWFFQNAKMWPGADSAAAVPATPTKEPKMPETKPVATKPATKEVKKLVFQLEREIFNSTCTLGKIYEVNADGSRKFICHCLEDVLRPAGVKVKGRTAIQAGVYKVIVDMSTAFKRLMCKLLNVKDFDGIRIHGGNTAEHSRGCLIVAKNKVSDTKIQGSMEQYFTDTVAAATKAGMVVEIHIGYAPNVTPVYQTDVNAGA